MIEAPPPGGPLICCVTHWAAWLAVVGGTWLFFRRTRGRPGKARLVLGNLLVLASIAWTVVALAETYLRYVYDQSDQYALTMTNAAWLRRHMCLNSAGFRDREWPPGKPPGVVRVACVGDSFTMAWGVRDVNEAWPQRVGAALELRTPGRFDVRNLGAAGSGTGEEADLVDQIRRDGSYDRIVLGYCLNDTDDLLPRGRRFDRRDMPRLPIDPEWSFLADFLWFRLRLRDDPRVSRFFEWEVEAYDDPTIWSRQCARFRRIAEACSAAAIRLDVVVFPLFFRWDDGYPFDPCHDRVAEAWRPLGVDVMDLRDAYRGIPQSELVANRLDSHPNARAHEIAAKVVLDRAFGVR